MPKETGMGMTVGIDNSVGALKQIENDIHSFAFNTPQGLLDITGLDKSGMERLIGLSDGSVTLTGTFNDDADQLWDVVKIRTGTRTVTIIVSGDTLTMEMLIGGCAFNRATDGSLQITADLQLQSGTVPAWS